MATASGFRAVGGCRCDSNPVRYEYTKRPFETHFCCCTDCTDICGGALALISVVERNAFRITQGESKIKNYDTKATCHRRFCGDCGCHMFLYVDAFPISCWSTCRRWIGSRRSAPRPIAGCSPPRSTRRS